MRFKLMWVVVLSLILVVSFVFLTSCQKAATSEELVRAAAYGNQTEVKRLLDKGADVNAKNAIGGTALMWASLGGLTELAELLLDRGADVNAKDSFGQTALFYASRQGQTELAELLLDRGADVNAKESIGQTALMEAARTGKPEVVKLLLDKGADVNAKDSLGWTALYLVRRMIETDGRLKDFKFNIELVDASMAEDKKGRGEVLEILKAAGAKE